MVLQNLKVSISNILGNIYISIDFLTWPKISYLRVGRKTLNCKYTLMIVDKVTGYLVRQNCKSHENASKKAISMLMYMERQHCVFPKTISIDRELCTNEFEEFMFDKGVKPYINTPDQSHENWLVERFNQTMADMVRSILLYKEMNERFW